jgi:hypothetical protein
MKGQAIQNGLKDLLRLPPITLALFNCLQLNTQSLIPLCLSLSQRIVLGEISLKYYS